MVAVPAAIGALFDDIADQAEELLGGNYVGLYVHGSIAMGCFNPLVSDVDCLIVVRAKLSLQEKRDLAKTLLDREYRFPKGIEMSVVLLKHTRTPVFPTPYEFHLSNEWAERYRRDEVDLSEENSDPDLAAHFMITRRRGAAWRGLPVDEVFADVPKEFYTKSLLHDLDDLNENILANPVYGILNACRTIAYLRDGPVLSKKEGGEWALQNFDEQHAPLVRRALWSYETGERLPELDGNARDAFVGYVKGMVEKFT